MNRLHYFVFIFFIIAAFETIKATEVPNVYANRSCFSIPVEIDSDIKIRGVLLKFQYDKTFLNLTKIDLSNGILNNYSATINYNLENGAMASISGYSNLISGKGLIADIYFSSIGDINSSSEVFLIMKCNEQNVPGGFLVNNTLHKNINIVVENNDIHLFDYSQNKQIGIEDAILGLNRLGKVESVCETQLNDIIIIMQTITNIFQ